MIREGSSHQDVDTDLVLRAGVPEDIESMYRLDLACFAAPFRFSRSQMQRYLREPGAAAVVGESGRRFAGFIIVSMSRQGDEKLAYITTLDVALEFRRRGLARRLMERAEAQAAGRGAASMVLHVWTGNAAAIRFYESAGYRRVSRAASFYNVEVDAWVYKKQLRESCLREAAG